MWQDPIVEQVRKQRLKIERDCGNNLTEIFKQAMKIQKQTTIQERWSPNHQNLMQLRRHLKCKSLTITKLLVIAPRFSGTVSFETSASQTASLNSGGTICPRSHKII